MHRRRGGREEEIQPVEDDGDAAPAPAAPLEVKARPPARLAAAAAVPDWARGTLLAACLASAFCLYLLAPTPGPDERLFTAEQLGRYKNGGRRLYLAIVGQVFDVSMGARHYGKGGGYRHFVGCDASKSFVTGDFKADLTDDLEGLLPEQVADIVGWRKFYREHKEYKAVGRLVGRFYDARGNPTPARAEAEAHAAAVGAERAAKAAANAAATAAQQQQQQQEEEAQRGAEELASSGSGSGQGAYLPCNVKWTRAEGGWVWCPDQGHPRRMRVPVPAGAGGASAGGLSERCGCMEDAEVTEGRRLYEGCDPGADRCQTSPPEPDG